jgi:hypothetical protein
MPHPVSYMDPVSMLFVPEPEKLTIKKRAAWDRMDFVSREVILYRWPHFNLFRSTSKNVRRTRISFTE